MVTRKATVFAAGLDDRCERKRRVKDKPEKLDHVVKQMSLGRVTP